MSDRHPDLPAHHHLALDLLEGLGIPTDRVVGVELRITRDEAPTITVHRNLIIDGPVPHLEPTLQRFELHEVAP
jgi:hypothetical protein